MMERYALDIDASNALCKKHAPRIERRQCYKNIANIVANELTNFVSGEWTVVYGYYTTSTHTPNLLARHCFIVDKNNQVIDPTVMLYYDNDDELKNHEYFAVKRFDNIQEYFRLIIQDQYYSLDKSLRQLDCDAIKWGYENGYVLIS